MPMRHRQIFRWMSDHTRQRYDGSVGKSMNAVELASSQRVVVMTRTERGFECNRLFSTVEFQLGRYSPTLVVPIPSHKSWRMPKAEKLFNTARRTWAKIPQTSTHDLPQQKRQDRRAPLPYTPDCALNNIAAHEMLFRLGIVSDLFTATM
jgi:hypothetical protein